MKALLFIGPSGSGKSTLCNTLSDVYRTLFGSDTVLKLNLDCASTEQADICISELITLEDIMEEYSIGPNASLLYAIDFLYANIAWLHEQIREKSKGKHCIFMCIDLPGQIELYLNHPSMKLVLKDILSKHTINSCVLELFDATHLRELSQFISMCMVSLASIVNMELPHINLLSKIDLLKGAPPALGILNDYLSLQSVAELVTDLMPPECVHGKHTASEKLLPVLAKVLDDHSLVSFVPCSIYKEELLAHLIFRLEEVFGTEELTMQTNERYKEFTKDCRVNFATQRLINELQANLFQQDME